MSGLRLRESVILSWDKDSLFRIDLTGKRPRFRIKGDGQKSGRDELLPLTPDFAEWLLATFPEGQRHGRVFKLNGYGSGAPIAPHRVGELVVKIGRRAAVVVATVEKKVRRDGKLVQVQVKKSASAHDLRRTFGTRWARKVMPAVLQKLMRHEDIQITMAFYVDLDVDEMAEEL